MNRIQLAPEETVVAPLSPTFDFKQTGGSETNSGSEKKKPIRKTRSPKQRTVA